MKNKDLYVHVSHDSEVKYIEINPPLIKNTGNISRGSCALVSLSDFQTPDRGGGGGGG